MCSGASIMARISRVVLAVPDPKMGLLGGAASIHEIESLNHSLEVESGVMQEECLHLLQSYFQMKRLANESRPKNGGEGWN